MKFLKKHWFAICFDLAFAATCFFCNPPTGKTIAVTTLLTVLLVGLQVFVHKAYAWWKRLPIIRHFYKEEQRLEQLENKNLGKNLSTDERKFFQKVMTEVNENLSIVQHNMRQAPQLKRIEQQTKVLKACEGIYQELCQNPNHLNLMGDFLYSQLPNLRELTSQYLDVYAHALKTEETGKILQQSEETIFNLSLAIVNEYKKMTSADLLTLSDSIALAQHNLQKIQAKEK